MRRYYLFFILLIFISPALGWVQPVSAQQIAVVRFDPHAQTLNPGEKTTIEVWVDDVTELWAFALEISFDPALFTVSYLEPGGFLSTEPGKFQIIWSLNNDLGLIKFDMTQWRITDTDPLPRDGSGVLIRFDIQAKSQAGVSVLSFDDVILSKRDGFLIPTRAEDGVVSVAGALDDAYRVDSSQTLTVSAPGVLANDISPAGSVLKAVLVTQPPVGTLTWSVGNDGGFRYTPPGDWAGTTSFFYQACTGQNCFPAAVTITVSRRLDQFVFLPLFFQ